MSPSGIVRKSENNIEHILVKSGEGNPPGITAGATACMLMTLVKVPPATVKCCEPEKMAPP
jgi:hypothetical protein